MAYVLKAEVSDPRATRLTFPVQKTMYGGKHIAEGDTVFVFASETQGGRGLLARGVVTSAEAIPRRPGLARQTPCVSITIRTRAFARRPLGRSELRRPADGEQVSSPQLREEARPGSHRDD